MRARFRQVEHAPTPRLALGGPLSRTRMGSRSADPGAYQLDGFAPVLRPGGRETKREASAPHPGIPIGDTKSARGAQAITWSFRLTRDDQI